MKASAEGLLPEFMWSSYIRFLSRGPVVVWSPGRFFGKHMNTFSATERKSLEPFFTNLDRPVFGLRLPQEIAGALFSRYSRSTRDLRRTFLKEFLGDPDLALKELLATKAANESDGAALQKARAFYERVLVGYGDDSVAQLGGAHVACEAISNVAAKMLEDARVGIAPLEKSTRYVRFDQRDVRGRYLFYVEPRIRESVHHKAYMELMELLFDTYAAQIDPVIEYVQRALPLDETTLRNPRNGQPITYADARNDPELRRWAETAYRATVRAHACDILRGYLPAATLTNVGLFGVGQAFEYLISKLYSSQLEELRGLGTAIHEELDNLIPSFVKRARANPYLSETFAATRALAQKVVPESVEDAPAVRLIDYDSDAEERILATILYPHCRHPMAQLRRWVSGMADETKGDVLEAYLTGRRHRRDKPGRAFEQVYYTFDIIGNLGLYRDLQRHRMLSQERQDFTTVHGYDLPSEIAEAGFENAFGRCMDRAAQVYEQIHRDLPMEAQYVVPFAYRVRWYMKMNLREAVHIGELRTMPQGHPDYRSIIQEMWRQIRQVHPRLAKYAAFIDWNTYRLGRLASEMHTEFKKSSL
jgi:thymidylate synthase ThyX